MNLCCPTFRAQSKETTWTGKAADILIREPLNVKKVKAGLPGGKAANCVRAPDSLWGVE